MDTVSDRPNRPYTPPPAASDTTRDQRLQAQTLHDVGLTYTQIHEQLGLTLRQVQYAISHRITPKNAPDDLQDLLKRRLMKSLHGYAFLKRIDVLLGSNFLQY
jgi:Homeodomain-like domain